MDYSHFKRKLKSLIENGMREFVIYPYGQNGKIIKQMLEADFNVAPVIIADNALCKNSEIIVSGDDLARAYNKNYFIILTVQDPKINYKMHQQLTEFCDEDKILNILELQATGGQYRLPTFSGFRLSNIIECEKQEVHGKIKVRILNFSMSTWNAIHSLCAACAEDPEIDLLILMGNKNKSRQMCSAIEQENYHSIGVDTYKVEKDQPDILVVSHPYDIFTEIKDCRRYCKMIVVASMQLVRYAHEWTTFLHQQVAGFGRYYPDYYLFDSLLYWDMVSAGFAMDNIIEIGNAKFDGIYQRLHENTLPEKWSKLKGKKIILWTTDHGVHDGIITEDVTFDLYGRYIFDIAQKHPDIGFVFRPHKALINELLNAGLWSEQDWEKLYTYCEESVNVVYDDSLTYDDAFSVADAIITDAYCGITCSALPLLKPMCLLYRNKDDLPYHQEIEESCYSARSVSDIQTFVEMVIAGKDEKALVHKRMAEKCIKNFDGKNGERIKNFLKDKIQRI